MSLMERKASRYSSVMAISKGVICSLHSTVTRYESLSTVLMLRMKILTPTSIRKTHAQTSIKQSQAKILKKETMKTFTAKATT
jgi:hypothetical protein